MPEINNDIFNEEISSEKIKEKYKKDWTNYVKS